MQLIPVGAHRVAFALHHNAIVIVGILTTSFVVNILYVAIRRAARDADIGRPETSTAIWLLDRPAPARRGGGNPVGRRQHMASLARADGHSFCGGAPCDSRGHSGRRVA